MADGWIQQAADLFAYHGLGAERWVELDVATDGHWRATLHTLVTFTERTDSALRRVWVPRDLGIDRSQPSVAAAKRAALAAVREDPAALIAAVDRAMGKLEDTQ